MVNASHTANNATATSNVRIPNRSRLRRSGLPEGDHIFRSQLHFIIWLAAERQKSAGGRAEQPKTVAGKKNSEQPQRPA
jgi:hypothetical protein